MESYFQSQFANTVFQDCNKQLSSICDVMHDNTETYCITYDRKCIYITSENKYDGKYDLQQLNIDTFQYIRAREITQLLGKVEFRISNDKEYLILYNKTSLIFANLEQYFADGTHLWCIENSKFPLEVNHQIVNVLFANNNKVFVQFQDNANKKKRTYYLIETLQETDDTKVVNEFSIKAKVVIKGQEVYYFNTFEGKIFCYKEIQGSKKQFMTLKDDDETFQDYCTWPTSRIFYKAWHEQTMVIFNRADGAYRVFGFDFPVDEFYYYLAYQDDDTKVDNEFLFYIDYTLGFYNKDTKKVTIFNVNTSKVVNVFDINRYNLPILENSGVMTNICKADYMFYKHENKILKIDVKACSRTSIMQMQILRDYFDGYGHHNTIQFNGRYLLLMQNSHKGYISYYDQWNSNGSNCLKSFEFPDSNFLYDSVYIEEYDANLILIKLVNTQFQLIIHSVKENRYVTLLMSGTLCQLQYSVNENGKIVFYVADTESKKIYWYTISENLQFEKTEKSFENLSNSKQQIQFYTIVNYFVHRNNTSRQYHIINFEGNVIGQFGINQFVQYSPVTVLLDKNQLVVRRTSSKKSYFAIFDFKTEQLLKKHTCLDSDNIVAYDDYWIQLKESIVTVFDSLFCPQYEIKFRTQYKIGSNFQQMGLNSMRIVQLKNRKDQIYIFSEAQNNIMIRFTLFDNKRIFRNDFRQNLGYIQYCNFIKYNDEDGSQQYYRREEDGAEQLLYKNNAFFTDEFYYEIKELPSKDEETIVQKYKNAGLEIYLANLYPYLPTFLHQIALKYSVLDEFQKKIQLYEAKDITQFILKDIDGKTALDYVVEQNQRLCMDKIIEMAIKYQNEIVYNVIFDKHICSFIKNGISLKEYLNSKLPLIEISSKNFPSLHQDGKSEIYGFSCASHFDVLTKQSYVDVIGKDLGDQIEEEENRDAEENDKFKHTIEYFLINLPVTLTTNKKQFVLFNFFVFAYILDFYLSQTGQTEETMSDAIKYILIVIRVLGCLILIYFLTYEIRTSIKQMEEYLKDPWNIFDISLVVFYCLYVISNYANVNENTRIGFNCAVLMLCFIKLNFFLRMFEGFSFLVSMLIAVFGDLKFFIIIFLMIIIEFGLLFTIVVPASDAYDRVGLLGYYLMSLRTSFGEFQLEDYDSDSGGLPLIILRWVIWISGAFALNVIFMNFIIAVISESYEKVMQRLIAQSYRMKVDLIAEREDHFTQDDLNNPEYFPRFFVVRRPANSDATDAAQWQGFLKDIKEFIQQKVKNTEDDLSFKINLVYQETLKEFTAQQKKWDDRWEKADVEIKKTIDAQLKAQIDYFNK